MNTPPKPTTPRDTLRAIIYYLSETGWQPVTQSTVKSGRVTLKVSGRSGRKRSQ